MQSKLSISEFRNKIKNSTKIGHPKLKFFTPFSLLFYDSSKPFFGRYDETTFGLTSNLKVSQCVYIVRGEYKVEKGKLQIQYKILPRYKYQYHFWIFCAIYGFALLVYINIKAFNSIKINDLITINLLYLAMLLYGFFMITRGKKKLEKKFIEIFEIENN